MGNKKRNMARTGYVFKYGCTEIKTFWDTIPCRLVNIALRRCLHHQEQAVLFIKVLILFLTNIKCLSLCVRACVCVSRS
jgi:hypothetical protein